MKRSEVRMKNEKKWSKDEEWRSEVRMKKGSKNEEWKEVK